MSYSLSNNFVFLTFYIRMIKRQFSSLMNFNQGGSEIIAALASLALHKLFFNYFLIQINELNIAVNDLRGKL